MAVRYEKLAWITYFGRIFYAELPKIMDYVRKMAEADATDENPTPVISLTFNPDNYGLVWKIDGQRVVWEYEDD